MDRAYAELSAMIGMFAFQADAYLGGTHFREKCRGHAWEFSVEWFVALRQEAAAMGVPVEQCDYALTADDRRMIEHLMSVQREEDRRSLH